MQITPRYLVNNRITIIANEAGYITEYRPVYQRHVQVYKGIDNTLQFKLINSDQKPINTSQYTPYIVLFDENKNQILEKQCDVLDDGSTAQRGLFTVRLTDGELLNIDEQYISFTIYLVDSKGDKVLTYSDSHFGASGTIYFSSEAFPGPKQSHVVSTFTKVDKVEDEDDYWISEVSNLNPEENNNEAVHTAAIYSSEFSGTVTVEVTLENQITGTTSWAEVESVDLNNNTQPVPVNFRGVYRFIRFTTKTDPSDKISKILMRN